MSINCNSKFTNSYNKGFRMTFGNGFSISVQWGVGNYCEKKESGQWDESTKYAEWDSNSAEIAVFDKNGGYITITNYPDVVAGWLSADTVAKCITIIQSATTKEEIETKIRALNL